MDDDITITLGKNRMVVKGEGDTGWLQETVKNDYAGEKVSFSIFPAIFGDILKQVKEGTIHPDNKLVKFVGENWEHVVALRRL